MQGEPDESRFQFDMQNLLKTSAFMAVLLTAAVVGFYLSIPAPTDISTTAASQCFPDGIETGNDQVWIEGGSFIMGESAYYPEEGPLREITVEGFWIDRHEVSNAQFARFVQASGYITEAEKKPDPSLFPGIPEDTLTPGSVVFIMPTDIQRGGDVTQWWQYIPGANWRQPLGPGSDIHGKEYHPVVHVTYADALAYAQWAGRDLPTEAEWEYAARGGLERQTYSWGNELKPAESWQANIWQGTFPLANNGEDGYTGTAPVGCYPPNRYGLHDMTGNVWEWVSDWYYPNHEYANHADPDRPGFDPRQPGVPVRVIKGGSYLCAKNYCVRYRPAARQPQETTLSAAHIGFRTVSGTKSQ